jgi:hypothetical protein
MQCLLRFANLKSDDVEIYYLERYNQNGWKYIAFPRPSAIKLVKF